MREGSIMRRIQVAISKLRARVFRNNCGQLQTREGRWIRYGVANPGGADLIGWKQYTVQPKDVGKTFAIFLAIEVKNLDGKLSKEQEHFIAYVNQIGGCAFVAHSDYEAEHKLRGKYEN